MPLTKEGLDESHGSCFITSWGVFQLTVMATQVLLLRSDILDQHRQFSLDGARLQLHFLFYT